MKVLSTKATAIVAWNLSTMEKAGVVLFFALAVTALRAATPVADVSGVWIATEVPYAPWVFELQQVGSQLTGSAWQTGAVTAVASVDKGTVQGNEIAFEVTGGAGSTGGTIAFKGVRDGNVIALVRTPSRSGTSGDGLYGAAAVRSLRVTRLPPGSAPPARPGAPVPLDARAARSVFAYQGMQVDVTTIQSRPDKDAIIKSIRAQIDLMDVDIKDHRLREFLATVPLVMAANPVGTDNAVYSSQLKQITLMTAAFSRDKPIIHHELMHAYHDQKLPAGFANPQILQLYQQAKASGKFPAGSYMLSNVMEYFAMMASVYLHGSAARDPFTRAAILKKQPECYEWLVKEFGPR